MNISRFFGSTNREALRQVRLALGPDALIISNKRINGGVEILATDPTAAPAAAASAAAASLRAAGSGSGAPASGVGVPAAGVPAAGAPGYRVAPAGSAAGPGVPQQAYAPPLAADPRADVMSAIGDMRGALESRIDELLWGNQLKQAPQAAQLFQTLLGFGFSTALLRAMLKRLPGNLSAKAAFQWARKELQTHLPVLSDEDAFWAPGKAIALVGPTGVGKTTSVAKLAARCVRRSGHGSLVLLTTDTYRIGAHEQLKIYGQIMRVPVHVVQDADELRRVMQGIRADQTILIDNVGISQRDRYVAEQAAMLAGAGRQVDRLLVLNASSHGDTLDEVARSYFNDGGSPLAGCIITKVDEASRLGAALDTSLRYQLPIHFVSNGQKVPENLLFPNAAELVDQALAHSHQSSALYAPSEADFAALMALSKAPQDDSRAAVAESRRKRLLPGLLSMAGEGGSALSMEDLQAACVQVDDSPSVSEAYDLWRSHAAGKSAATPVSGAIRNMLRGAQAHVAERGGGYLLAVHDQVAIQSPAGQPGQLRATLALGSAGQALTTLMQQLSLADGWFSSCGAAAQAAPAAADALHHQVRWLAGQFGKSPVVHLFEGGSQALWRRLNELDATWLTQVSAGTRIEHEGCATTVGAVAKTLMHRPVVDSAQLPDVGRMAGLPASEVVLWAAGARVEVQARQQPALPLMLVSVRVLSRRDGATLKVLHGLANAAETGISAESLAAWLVLRAEAKQAMRYASRFWQLLSQRGDEDAALTRALTAVQAGMAAWRLKQHPDAELARTVAGNLVGKPGLPVASVPAGVLKLFALKEMVEA